MSDLNETLVNNEEIIEAAPETGNKVVDIILTGLTIIGVATVAVGGYIGGKKLVKKIFKKNKDLELIDISDAEEEESEE